MKTKIFFSVLLIIFSVELFAQHTFTATKKYIGENQSIVKIENELGNYIEYFIPLDTSFVQINNFSVLNNESLFDISTHKTPLNIIPQAKTINVIDPEQKINAMDIYYSMANNKIYISGGEKLNIYNSNDLSLFKSISLLDEGSPVMYGGYSVRPKQQFICENTEGSYIFVSSRNNNVFAINTTTYEIEKQFSPEDDLKDLTISEIVYEPILDRVYFIYHSWSFKWANILVIDVKTLNEIKNVFFDSYKYFSHFTPSSDGSTLVSSYDKVDEYGGKHYGIVFFNSDLEIIMESEINYLNIPSNDNTLIISNNKVFVHSYYFIDVYNQKSIYSVFDLDDFSLITSREIPAGFCTDVGVSESLNQVYFLRSYYHDNTNSSYFTAINSNTYRLARNQHINDYSQSFFEIDQENNAAYIGSDNNIKKINLETYGIIEEGENAGCFSFDLAYNPYDSQNKLFTANTFDGTIGMFDENCILKSIYQCEVITHMGCSNTQNNKVYFINSRSNYENSDVVIISEGGEIIKKQAIGADLTDIEYNESSNKIFVSSKGSKLVKVIDGNTNEIIYTITLEDEPMRLLSFNEKIYIQTYSKFIEYDVNTYEFTIMEEFVAPYNETNIYFPDMILNDNVIYAAYIINGFGNFIYSYNTETFEEYKSETYVELLLDLDCNTITDEIYGLFNTPELIIFDRELNPIDEYLLFNSVDAMSLSMSFDKYNNKLFMYYDGVMNFGSKLAIYDVVDKNLQYITTEQFPNAIFFNQINDQIYFHGVNINSEIVINTYDALNNNFLHQFTTGNNLFEDFFLFGWFYLPKAVLTKDFDRLYIGNGAFSNITVINPYIDKYTIRDGWTWLSFPRIERYAGINESQEPQYVLNKIHEFPKDLTLKNEVGNEAKYQLNSWTGNLTQIQSTEGYKLHIDLDNNHASPNFEFHGGKLDPDYPINIHPGENWKGYFIEYPQYVEDCIPQEVLNDITMIKTQDWAITRINGQWSGFGQTKQKPLKYGDMVVIYSNNSHSFSWIRGEEAISSSELPPTIHYFYKELSDYLPVFVEIDKNSIIKEIAILINGRVIGASTVSKGETIIGIKAYIPESATGTYLSFETWDGTSSSIIAQNAYKVYNPVKEINEKRRISTNEDTPYQFVSITNDNLWNRFSNWWSDTFNE